MAGSEIWGLVDVDIFRIVQEASLNKGLFST